MKKLLSVLLALVMVFSLTVPAFADGPDGPAPDDTYTNWAKESWAEICAEQPEETAQFLKELPVWFAEHYTRYDSFEDFCTQRGYSAEEAYLSLFMLWNWDYIEEQTKTEFITSHGGTPGQINVMLNGKCVKFTDAAPEVKDGRTMVPFRAIFESLGAEIAYDNGKIHAALGDTALDLTIGSDTMTKTAAGETSTVKMDCAPYAKGGRTYVPVRFISEALGYDVQWDGYYNTAVLTDLDALAEKIDKDFTIYNKLAAKNALTDKTRKSVGSGRADVTLFDTLNGDKTGKATYSYDLTASTAGASGKLEYDFTELWALIKGYIPMPLDMDGSDEYTKQLEMIESLMKGSAEVRMDLEKGKVYVSMPNLFEAMGDELAAAGLQITKNAWLSVSLDNIDMDELTGMMVQTPTIGKLLTTIAGTGSVSGDYSARNYDSILEAAEMFGKLYGDAKFTRKGNANVLTFTKEDLAALAGDDSYTSETLLESLSKFEYTLTVKDNGDMEMDGQARIAISGSDFMDLSSKSTTRGGKTESTMELHVKNVLKATVKLQETVTETDKAPEVTPPKDVLVLPLDGTLPGGTISSPDGPTQTQP